MTAQRAWALNAVVAWGGILVTVVLSGLGAYVETTPETGLYGDTGDGLYGAVQRLTDTFSYFTIWSNVVVAIAATLLATGPDRDTRLRRVLRLDAVLMITVTAIVYQVLLAPTADVRGWSHLTDPWLHIVTPIVTVAVWIGWGPRGWITGRLLPLALVVPLIWIVWMLARGAVIDAYPYDFADVDEFGYASVSVTLALILVFGLVIASVYWGLDVLLRRRSSQPPEASV